MHAYAGIKSAFIFDQTPQVIANVRGIIIGLHTARAMDSGASKP